jgi:hypothetical protein
MRPGENVKLLPQRLYSGNSGIRFDISQVAASTFAPGGATGVILQVTKDENEALVELYWNAAGGAGLGETWKIWVKRESFGSLFTVMP